MKRRRFPLKGDHDLLTPDTRTLSGVRQEQSGCVALLSGQRSNPCAAASRSTRRHQAASPTRRLRFEDETEMEAESRYLERQRRPGGLRGTGVLVAKPDLNMYINGRRGVWLKDGHAVDMQQRGQTAIVGTDQSDSQTLLGGGVSLGLNVRLHSPVTDRGRNLSRYSQVRTEPIRETYIGTVTLSETSGGNGTARYVSHMQVRRSTSQVELKGPQVTVPQGTSSTDLPVNPYAPHMATSGPTSFVGRPLSQSDRLSDTKAGPNLNHNQKERCPCAKETDVKDTMNSSSSSGKSSETAAENQSPTTASSSDGHPHSDKTPPVEHFRSRDDSSRLSLRHLFSTVRLSRTRTGSLDRFSTKTRNSDSGLGSSGTRKPSSLLKKSPSVQSLSMGSPILQKKSSSVHSFESEPKKSKDRSADYRPAAEHTDEAAWMSSKKTSGKLYRFLQHCLSVKDVSHPRSARAVGRVHQVCSDGTIVLELNQPMGQMYGFIISRGRGRPDSGVYVEDMGDSNTAKLYAGLLAVGDEILEVNGEKVSNLSLDQVTYLLAQNPSAAVRVLRHRKTSPR